MKKTGLSHLDINSFPTVNPALETKLKVVRSLKIKKINKRQPEETCFKLLAPAPDSIWSFSHF